MAEPAGDTSVHDASSARERAPGAEPEAPGEPAPSPRPRPDPRPKKGLALRPALRALHRDMGYVAVGLTLVYAASGIAVNHLTDWKDGDASFKNYSRELPLASSPPKTGDADRDDKALADAVRAQLAIVAEPREVYRVEAGKVDITFDKRTLHVDETKQTIVDEGQEPRFFLRLANWLHLNRGKKQWTYVADAYAAGLLFLAISGMFMIPGKKGIVGRGGVLVAIGIAIPVLYVTLSGGP